MMVNSQARVLPSSFHKCRRESARLQAILNQIVRLFGIAGQGPRITPQVRTPLFELLQERIQPSAFPIGPPSMKYTVKLADYSLSISHASAIGIFRFQTAPT